MREQEADSIVKEYEDLELIQHVTVHVAKMFPQRQYNKTIIDNNTYKPTYKDQMIEALKCSAHKCIIHTNKL